MGIRSKIERAVRSLIREELRDLSKMRTFNCGNRTLFESVMSPEVLRTLRDWKAASGQGVLIGGLGLSYYAKPRMTQGIDILFSSKSEIPSSVDGFRRHRQGAFEHKRTGVEVETIAPETINVSPALIQQVIDSAVWSEGIRIASASGLVALKLQRYSRQDQADIVALIATGRVDISGFYLTSDQRQRFEELKREAHGR